MVFLFTQAILASSPAVMPLSAISYRSLSASMITVGSSPSHSNGAGAMRTTQLAATSVTLGR